MESSKIENEERNKQSSMFIWFLKHDGFCRIRTLGVLLAAFCLFSCSNKFKVETEKNPKKFIKATCANGLLSDAECNSASKTTDAGDEEDQETEPTSPTGFSLTNPTATSILLSWSLGSENTDSFVLERKLPTGNWTQIASLDKGTLSYFDTTRPTGVNVSYRLKAVNDVGTSDPADAVTGSAAFVPTLGLEISGTIDGEYVGTVVSSAGDVNGDGKPDILTGAPYAEAAGSDRGKAYVYSGADGSVLHTIVGTQNTAYLGNAVAGAGDVDGDGKDDFLVAEHQADAGGTGRGRVMVYSGASGSIIRTLSGTQDAAKLGGSVASIGDINGDGRPDHVVGELAGGASSRGNGYVYSGANGSILFTLNGTENNAAFGRGAPAGDVNGDGTQDFFIGESGADVGGNNRGKVYVYSGTDASLIHTFSGTEDLSGLGGDSMAPAGDVNGDGKGDLIIAEFLLNLGGTDRGRVTVYSGADKSVLYTFNGAEDSGWFGESVANAGDVNGDGKDDFVIGQYRAGANDRGKVYVYSGADGTLLYTFTGLEDFGYLGSSVASAGDVNGDGRADLLIGEYSAAAGGTGRGKIYVYLSP